MVMELYYHVNFIKKKKFCRFDFSYVKNLKEEISGNVEVNLKNPGKKAVFDPLSDTVLEEKEKLSIVSNVLKHLQI